MTLFKTRGDVELRPFEDWNARELFQLIDRNRAHLRRWLPWVDANRTLSDSQRFIRLSNDINTKRTGLVCGVWHVDTLAGVIDLQAIDWANRSTSIGYWLGAEFVGRGIMTNACRAIVDYGFGEFGLNRITILCATENRKSRAIPERLGFERECISRQAQWLYDHFVDLTIYSMLAGDWRTLRQHD